MGVIVGSDIIPMFIGAMIVGPLAAWVMKKFDRLLEGRFLQALMLVNTYSVLGAVLTLLTLKGVTPLVESLNEQMRGRRWFLRGQ